MHTLRSLVLASGLLVGLAAQAPAQLSITIGNPAYAPVAVTTPGLGGYSTFGGVGGTAYGYSSGYSGYSSYGGIAPGLGAYNSYSGYSTTGYMAGPGVIGGTYGYPAGYGYSSGYSGVVGNPYGYRNRAYGYGGYPNGAVNGFRSPRPFNNFRRF